MFYMICFCDISQSLVLHIASVYNHTSKVAVSTEYFPAMSRPEVLYEGKGHAVSHKESGFTAMTDLLTTMTQTI